MRSRAVDWLKCAAALLVINTHLTPLLPPAISFAAWGGFFANSIFFFVSGYCLTNVSQSFPKWYWKRFVRVYLPYLLILPLLYFAGRTAGWNWVNYLMPLEEYHFIPSLLFLYIVYYFLTRLHQGTKFGYALQIPALALFAVCYFFFFFDRSRSPIEHFSLIETIFYLIPMLLGGLAREGVLLRNRALCLGLAAASFAAYIYQDFRPFAGYLSILQPMIGLGFSYGLGCFALSAESRLPKRKEIEFISSVTLECYLVQFVSREAFAPVGFPTNIVYHVICTLAAAYCLHRLAGLILKRPHRKNAA